MGKSKGISIVFDNTMGLTAEDINIPIKKNNAVIGVITFVNEKSVYGLLWDKSISFNENECSFEIKDTHKTQSGATLRTNRR